MVRTQMVSHLLGRFEDEVEQLLKPIVTTNVIGFTISFLSPNSQRKSANIAVFQNPKKIQEEQSRLEK